jgi:hypothetical protein
MKWRSVLAAAVAVVGLAAPALVRAQTVQDALKAVPKEATGFLVVSNVTEASNKITDLCEQLKINLPGGPLQLAKGALGIRKGLNEEGAALLVLIAPPNLEGEPVVILYAPTADYKALLQEVKAKDPDADATEFQPPKGEALFIAKKGSFAAVAKLDQKEAVVKALKSGGGAAGATHLLPWISKNNISGVVTVKGLKELGAKALEGLGTVKGALAQAPPEVGEIAGNVIGGIEDFIRSAQTDLTAVAFGVRMDKSGAVHLGMRALFAKGSGFARGAEGTKVPDGGPLAGLPARPYAIAVGGALPESCLKSLMSINGQVLKILLKDQPEEKLKKIESAYAEMGKGIRSISFMMGPPKEGQSLFNNIIAVIKADDAVAYLDRQEKGTRMLNEALKGVEVPFAAPSEMKRIKVDGRPGLETVVDMTKSAGVDELQKQIIEAMFGAKVTTTTVAIDDNTLLVRYTGPAGIKKLLASIKDKGELINSKEVAKVAAHLPKGAQWAGFISPHGIIEFVQKAVEKSPVPIPIPEMTKTPPIAIAAKVGATGFEGELIVPGPTLQGIAQYIQKVQRLQEQ